MSYTDPTGAVTVPWDFGGGGGGCDPELDPFCGGFCPFPGDPTCGLPCDPFSDPLCPIIPPGAGGGGFIPSGGGTPANTRPFPWPQLPIGFFKGFGAGSNVLGPTTCGCVVVPPSTIRGLLCDYACWCMDGTPDLFAFRCPLTSRQAGKLCPPAVIIYSPGLTGSGKPFILWPTPVCD